MNRDIETKYLNLSLDVFCEHVAVGVYPRATDEVAPADWLSYDEIKNRTDVPEFVERFVDRIKEVHNSAQDPCNLYYC